MAAHRLGRIVAACVIGGLVAGPASVLAGPVAGATENVVTATLLLAFASSWAMLAAISEVRINQPQRWSAMLAAFMAVAGVAVLLAGANDNVLTATGWIWPPLFFAILAMVASQVRRQLRSRTRILVVYPVLAMYALCAAGGLYQTIGETRDRNAQAPGQLVDVGGHRLHIVCEGAGSPVVVLESGLGETAAYWKWIAPEIARDTTVCTYDRAGRGWSDTVALPQDGNQVAADLHTLLHRAGQSGPFVLAGHSSGAQYVRIFAGRYPEELGGMVLLDGQPAEVFESLPGYPRFYNMFRRIFGVLPSLARLGVGRVLDAEYVSARHYRSLRDEFAALPTSLAQARSFQNLGDRPLVVLTATEDAMPGWLPLQDRMAALSRNSSHRLVPYTHDGLVTDRTAAEASITAIRDVVNAVRISAPINQP